MKKFALILFLALIVSVYAPAHSATSGRSCSATADPTVDSLTISPSGPLSMPAIKRSTLQLPLTMPPVQN